MLKVHVIRDMYNFFEYSIWNNGRSLFKIIVLKIIVLILWYRVQNKFFQLLHTVNKKKLDYLHNFYDFSFSETSSVIMLFITCFSDYRHNDFHVFHFVLSITTQSLEILNNKLTQINYNSEAYNICKQKLKSTIMNVDKMYTLKLKKQ